MSFKNIHLPDVVLSQLYKDMVVVDDEQQVSKPQQKVKPAGRSSSEPGLETTARTSDLSIQEKLPEAKKLEPTPEPPYKFLGNNSKHVTVVVSYPDETFIPESDLQVLTKILGACKLNLGDIALLNTGSSPAEMAKINHQFKPQKVLLFGVSPSEIGLPISFPEYKQQQYSGTVFVSAPSITRMNGESEENKLIKRKLWDCLKALFN